MNILQYESKIWATADLLRGCGIKESEWPSFMMPFFALAMGSSVLTFMVQMHSDAQALIGGLSLGTRIGNASISYCRYLGGQVWPVDLAVIYPHPLTWPLWKVLLAGAALLGISAISYRLRRRYPYVLMGWLWYLLTLVPVIGLIQVGGQAMADRYTYLPSVGLLIIAIWGIYDLTKDWRGHRILLSAMGSASVVLCLGLTRPQIGYWKDSETLFRHAIEVTENNYTAHNNLGKDLLDQGRIDEAFVHFEKAISIRPDLSNVHINLGMAYELNGQLNQAIGQYLEAIRLKPGWADPYYNLGTIYAKLGRVDEAITCLQHSIQLDPDKPEPHCNLGTMLGSKGLVEPATVELREAIRLNPNFPLAHRNLAYMLELKGRFDEAIFEYQEAIRLDANDGRAREGLARTMRIRTNLRGEHQIKTLSTPLNEELKHA